MANTTNLSLGKLAGTENLKNFPTVQSDNMDKIDQAVGAGFGSTRNVGGVTDALADAIAILANGNTHAAITSGQYVYVKNHASLTEGLYVATTNIAANATLSGSNLTADSSGGLNAALASAKSYTDGLIGTVPSGNTVEGQITSLSNHIANKAHITIKPYNVTLTENQYVSPYTHFGTISTPFSETFGTVIGVTSRSSNCLANFDRSQRRITVVGTSATTVVVDVIFATNVEIKTIN